MSSSAPHVGDGPSPPRVLAVGGAVAITAIALAGSLGFGPGAQHSGDSQGQVTAQQPVQAAAGSGGGTTALTPPTSNRWLTLDQGPVGAGTSGGSDASGGANASRGANTGNHDASGSGNGSSSTTDSGSAKDTTPLPAGSGSGKRAVYDISAQRVWLVNDDGSVRRTYLVSGARQEDLLPPGTYSVYSRSLDAISFNNTETMKYMVRFAQGQHFAIGFHDIPVVSATGGLAQSRSQLGTPTSSGCIRQREPDAKAMWRFAPDGTSVVVVA